MENIIFHASHAGFMRDTRSIHANIQETVNSRVECSFMRRIFTGKSGKLLLSHANQKGNTIHAQCTMYRASEERKYCTSTFNNKKKNSLIFLFVYAIGYNNLFSTLAL